MTLPVERTRAVIVVEEFLLSLLDPKRTPRVPRSIRVQACACLRHYPREYEMAASARHMPHLWGSPHGR